MLCQAPECPVLPTNALGEFCSTPPEAEDFDLAGASSGRAEAGPLPAGGREGAGRGVGEVAKIIFAECARGWPGSVSQTIASANRKRFCHVAAE